MKIYDITVTGTTADWLTATRGNIPLPVFVRKLLTEIASQPGKYSDLTKTINASVGETCSRTTKE